MSDETAFFDKSVYVQKTGRLHRAQAAELARARDLIADLTKDGLKSLSALRLHQTIWFYGHGKPSSTPFDLILEKLEKKKKAQNARIPRPKKKTGKVYFIRGGSFIKIGFTLDVPSRLKSLQTSCPHKLDLVHHFLGGEAEERALHQKFSEHRSSGEWFREEGTLAAYVQELAHG